MICLHWIEKQLAVFFESITVLFFVKNLFAVNLFSEEEFGQSFRSGLNLVFCTVDYWDPRIHQLSCRRQYINSQWRSLRLPLSTIPCGRKQQQCFLTKTRPFWDPSPKNGMSSMRSPKKALLQMTSLICNGWAKSKNSDVILGEIHLPYDHFCCHWQNTMYDLVILTIQCRFLTSVGFTCCVMGTWEILLTSNTPALLAGGSAGLFWSVCWAYAGQAFVVLSLAEMASMAPTAGKFEAGYCESLLICSRWSIPLGI